MNLFSVFLPALFFLLAAVFLTFILSPFIMIAGGVLAIVLYTDWKSKNKTVEYKYILGLKRYHMTAVLTVLCAALAFAGYAMLFLSCSGPWLRAKPSADWKTRSLNTDTAIVLGFGIGKDDRGNRLAGKANRFLYDWAIQHTSSKTLLVQEGIRLAAMEMAAGSRKRPQPELVMIHPHSDKNYINTLQAAYFALKKMAELGKSRAVLVTHDLQLQRAYWDFVKVRRAHPEWKHIEIIVPRVPKTPFPGDSRQWHTRGGFRYKFIELFWSRPRDFLASAKKNP